MVEFFVLGRALRAFNADPQWERWLRNHWHYPQHELPRSDFTITLTQCAASPALEAGDWSTLPLMDQSVSARLEETSVTLADAHCGARLEVGSNSAALAFWGAAPVLGAVLHALVSEALRASGLLSLHASAAAQGNRVTAFLGDSGAGKTTTLLRAWTTGWQPVCEDLLWLEPAGLGVYGWDRGLRLLPDTLERFAALLPAMRLGSSQPDKWFVPYAELRLGIVGETLGLTRLALLRRGDDATTVWSPASRRETALALWQATGLPLTKVSQANVATAIAALTDRVDAHHLTLGLGDFSPLPDSETTP